MFLRTKGAPRRDAPTAVDKQRMLSHTLKKMSSKAWRLFAGLLLLAGGGVWTNIYAQLGASQGNSPLYSSRPYTASAPNGLPSALRDEDGAVVKLGDFFGKRAVVLSLVYYDCPMLCTQVLNGMVSAFNTMSFKPVKEFDVVTVSFDPRETSALAAAK